MIRETESEIEELLDAVPRFRPEDLDDDEFHLVGTPEQVAEDLERYREARFEEVVREFVDFPDTTGPELFVEEVAPQFD